MDLTAHAGPEPVARPRQSPRAAGAPAHLAAAALIAAAIFVADTLTRLEVAVAVLYVAVILIAIRIFERRGVLLVALSCAALTTLSYFLSREATSPPSGLINLVISLSAIMVSTYLALKNQSAVIALQEAQTELAHANRVTGMGQLTAAIVHEISQPIAGVVANAEAATRWLDAAPPNLEETRQALESIVEDGNRTGEIVTRIRALARKAPPRTELLDINQIILDVVALTRTQMQRSGIVLLTNLEAADGAILGDRIQLQQVFLNLILNGAEAMASVDGSRELRISTREHTPGSVLVTVSDLGPGVDAANLEQLFEAFHTTKPGGMGMGLSICRAIVEAHAGRIWASRNDGPGASFQFTLPGYREAGR
jgi:signal transduction histidine kinase